MTTLLRCGFLAIVVASILLSLDTIQPLSRAGELGEKSNKPGRPSIRIEPITDIWPGRGGVSPGIPKVYRGEAYFAAHNRGDGRDIWRFDGNRVAIGVKQADGKVFGLVNNRVIRRAHQIGLHLASDRH